MLKSLLIANRGEIACRIIRTARSMGIRTIAVYSDADARALHVRKADEAVHIGPSPARESYLVGEKIIAAAKATGAEAIHPGYGFLSENAEFAEAVIAAGLIWVGPKPDSIRAMGLKDAAKKLMDAAGVPTTPGYLGEDQSPERLAAEAERIGYPVLIKAVAGGGGKGMRKVDDAAGFADALTSCKREAAASFGNDVVLLEKWIESPRHIEVQVFGDAHGNVVHLFERDCSLQRRHQKVIEEAPAPGMDEATREAVCGAAVRAAKAVDYQGAGTIEFIADGSEGLRADRIWFMEMNTRLQVEHPVTEEITGVDLVEWQLRVASGEPIPLRQEELSINGWAMEARLYAEDPASGFLPSTGRLDRYCLPEEEARVDTGVEEMSVVSPFYDPMIAKIIVHGSDRDDAVDRLLSALEGTAVWPVKSNAGFLHKAASSAPFRSALITTAFIAEQGDALIPPAEPDHELLGQAGRHLVHAYADASRHSRDNELLEGFRLNSGKRTALVLQAGGTVHHLSKVPDFGGNVYSSAIDQDSALVTKAGQSFAIGLPRFNAGAAAAGSGSILSPMPGKVIAVDVAAGQQVAKGQKLLTLEAMKMEHSLVAPFDGVVAELNASEGAQVQVEALLVRIEAAAE
ncbi:MULTISPECIES: acetyl/propionyl/methylcrotonyl-CoA carboxylase subunit alpha [Pseudomonadota]|jgi:3-methylcrotonyl-CoA carboxylase alpha subunit|uniref:acetyl/propionyl/methylcrotonyl-CoA carboxylase subunit alpha n=1 Tax=Pseudomonadota TaxID=1224 RepID=UPI00076A30CE|nr:MULTISPECIES: acetyl/propionyl/methylcrotonyl-CoA carboxylase subunit alpha [Pseudomonadota]MAF61056.1 acetyl/propionyl/methylcrotonyl-CoA carboxylase subunit alpha [Blastomonas sp.]|tara:strand:+ start:83343 stop:85232 length:1890 start_codon:yes stop_codon:yes gene_type:complete